MGCLYRLTFPNGKLYFGITSETAGRRFAGHVKAAEEGSDLLLSRAIRRHGVESIVVEEILHSDDWRQLCVWEKEHIAKYQTKRTRGYNMTNGGDGSTGLRWTPEQRKKTSDRMRGNKQAAGCRHTPDGLRRMCEASKGNQRAKGNKKSLEGKCRYSAALALRHALRLGRPVSILESYREKYSTAGACS